MPHNIPAFFESYAGLYNRALAGEDVYGEIMDRFTSNFLAAGPKGVATGKTGGAFRRTLDKGYRFYRGIGAQKMTSRRVESTRIDGRHCLAKVFYRGEYVRPDGSPVSIDFDMSYLIDVSGSKPRIFAVVAGDEMELYRKHGLVPARHAAKATASTRRTQKPPAKASAKTASRTGSETKPTASPRA